MRLQAGGALRSQNQTFPFSCDLIVLSVPAGVNTLANDLGGQVEGWWVEMAECLLTSVGGCLGVWGLQWS